MTPTPTLPRIAVLDDYLDIATPLAPWQDVTTPERLTVLSEHIDDEDRLADAVRGCEVLCVMRERTPVTASLLDRLPGLRLIVTTGMNNASIEVGAAAERGIVVSGTSSMYDAPVELTVALVLALARQIPAADRAVKDGAWQTVLGRGVRDARLGLLGLGRIGTQVARIAQALGMRVSAWSPRLTAERAAGAGVEYQSFDDLVATSDFVSVHLRLGERTHHLVGAAQLARMKPTAYLVNTSRGPIVDETALLRTLHDGDIGGAALDVFDVEPLPLRAALRSAPNVILTPHIGYVTEENMRLFYRETVEDIRAFLDGSPIRVLQPPGS